MTSPFPYPPLDHWIWWIAASSIGACIGSFLNVVIYRVPLGLSVNEPKRSFCPQCKKTIPIWLNLPLLSWLWLRGRCRECKAPIAFRYFGVELLTSVFFLTVWCEFSMQSIWVIPFLWLFVALLGVVTFIDAEHLIIPTRLTWLGSGFGLLAALVWHDLPCLAGQATSGSMSLGHAVLGWLLGYGLLYLVIEFGKKAFGKKNLTYAQPVPWSLKEPENETEPLLFLISDETIPWWDIFSRKADQLRLETTVLCLDGKTLAPGLVLLRKMEIEMPDGVVYSLEDIKSVSGMATHAVIPREAMGLGDAHLLAMIGAFLGYGGVLFTIFSASLYALCAALVGRIGLGRQLPFGPFLALGALTWLFGAWRLWAWYLGFIGL